MAEHDESGSVDDVAAVKDTVVDDVQVAPVFTVSVVAALQSSFMGAKAVVTNGVLSLANTDKQVLKAINTNSWVNFFIQGNFGAKIMLICNTKQLYNAM